MTREDDVGDDPVMSGLTLIWSSSAARSIGLIIFDFRFEARVCHVDTTKVRKGAANEWRGAPSAAGNRFGDSP